MSETQKIFTYQDLARMFGVHAKTVARWFKGRKILRLNHSTVRITPAQLDLFIKESCKTPVLKK